MKSVRVLSAILFLLALSPLAIAANGENANGRVVGGPPNPAQYLYEVQLTAINGERIIPREMLTLAPGDYVLTARVPAQYTEPEIGRHKFRRDRDVDFTLTVEPGRDYSVRVKWNRQSLETPFELLVEPYE
jgi:hypothetical protein